MRRGTTVAAILFAIAFFDVHAHALDLLANRSDTFIYEAEKSSEFSKSELLAISRFKPERAIAYLPFTARGIDAGLDEKTDKILSATLSFYIKELPEFGAPENPQEKNLDEPDKDESKKDEKSAESPSEKQISAVAEVAIEAARKARDAAEVANADDPNPEAENSAEKNIIRIAVLGIVDDEVFEPNSKGFRVSWDGKNEAEAPKHDTVDGRIDMVGVYKLGTIELDVGKDTYDDGDKIEFQSKEFTTFMNFVYGINVAQNIQTDINTHLSKIENFAIILRQESGPRGVIIYSADSYGEEIDKPESGDEKEKKNSREENAPANAEKSESPSDIAAPTDPQNAAAKINLKDNSNISQNNDSKKNESSTSEDDSDDDSLTEIRKLPPDKMRAELEKFLYTSDNMQKYLEESGMVEKNTLKPNFPDDNINNENAVENKSGAERAEEKRDWRPKITFEHVRVIEQDTQ